MTNQNYFYCKDGQLKSIKLDKIFYLEAADNYVKFHEAGGYQLVRTTLEKALCEMGERKFVRIFRSYAVPVDLIDTISKDMVYLAIADKKALPVSARYYPEIIKEIKIINRVCDPME